MSAAEEGQLKMGFFDRGGISVSEFTKENVISGQRITDLYGAKETGASWRRFGWFW